MIENHWVAAAVDSYLQGKAPGIVRHFEEHMQTFGRR
jgi:hypothetical protein